MKLAEISRFQSRIKEHNPKWEYSDLQIELLSEIRKDVDGIHLANYIIKKFTNHKTKPTIDQIDEVIQKIKVDSNEPKSLGCDKCRNGFVHVFNHKTWYYDDDLGDCKSFMGWTPDQLESIFMLPKMDVACGCRNMKRITSIKSYLQWIKKYNFMAPRFFEICYIQLYLFYSQVLNGSLKFDQFNPYNFWGVEIDQEIDLKIDDIEDTRIADMLRDAENGGFGSNLRDSLGKLRRGKRSLPPNTRKDPDEML